MLNPATEVHREVKSSVVSFWYVKYAVSRKPKPPSNPSNCRFSRGHTPTERSTSRPDALEKSTPSSLEPEFFLKEPASSLGGIVAFSGNIEPPIGFECETELLRRRTHGRPFSTKAEWRVGMQRRRSKQSGTMDLIHDM